MMNGSVQLLGIL